METRRSQSLANGMVECSRSVPDDSPNHACTRHTRMKPPDNHFEYKRSGGFRVVHGALVSHWWGLYVDDLQHDQCNVLLGQLAERLKSMLSGSDHEMDWDDLFYSVYCSHTTNSFVLILPSAGISSK